jgi:hypothetical protein
MKFLRSGIAPVRRTFLALLLLSLWAIPSPAQTKYPKGYFLFPIMPGQPNYLAGNMGELRPNHFHAGLDVKTQGREGLPVYASADGYVSRVKIAWGGYGNALYLTHPNGLVTVYAHLKTFNKTIGDFVRGQQYAQKTFEIELLPDSTLLRVKRGDVIGFSGNTGGSGGPHLHYEVRDAQENVLNPEYFGFPEIKDNVAPVIDRLAVVALQPTARVRGEFGRAEVVPAKVASHVYSVKEPISVWGKVGLELLASDLTGGTPNRNGVSRIEVQMDGQPVFTHHLETFSFDVSRSINVHVNYDQYLQSHNRFQRCYVADGNELNTYTTDRNRGALVIRDAALHAVVVTVADAYGNHSQLRFTLRGTPPVAPAAVVTVSSPSSPWRYDVSENTLLLKRASVQKSLPPAAVYVKGRPVPLEMAYHKGKDAVYLWDLRRGLPDSVGVDHTTEATRLNFRALVPAGKRYLYEEDSLNILFDERSLFDSLYLETVRRDNRYQVGRADIPLRETISVRLKPNVPEDKRSRSAVYLVSGGRLSYLGGMWVGPEIEFKTKELGTFTLAYDADPPFAKLEVKTPSRIVCRISDNLSGIGKIDAYLDGKWLLMQYDYKTNLIWSDPLDGKQPLKGHFVLEVSDKAGNVKKLEAHL